MRNQAPGINERLDFIWLELTGRCNLECVHCYADSGPKRPLSEGMSLGDWIDALDEAAALGCKKVQFIGGEPTLYPGLPRLIAHARSAGYEKVWVYTNGTHFTEALKTAFVAHKVSLVFSVYGSSGGVHDQITQRAGSFEKTARAIRWAVEAGLGVRAGVVEMGANTDDVARTKRMLEEAGVGAVNVDRLRGLGRGSNERPAQPALKELCGRCGNGKVCVSSSGEIYPCVFARFAALGQIKDGGLAAAFCGTPLRAFREALIDSHAVARAKRQRASLSRTRAAGYAPEASAWNCNPEEPAGDCNPEVPAGDCNPEVPAGDCNPEEPAGDCNPEVPAGDCNPETGMSSYGLRGTSGSREGRAGDRSSETPPPDGNPEKPRAGGVDV